MYFLYGYVKGTSNSTFLKHNFLPLPSPFPLHHAGKIRSATLKSLTRRTSKGTSLTPKYAPLLSSFIKLHIYKHLTIFLNLGNTYEASVRLLLQV